MKRIRCHKKSSHKKKAEKILLVTAILNHVNSVMNFASTLLNFASRFLK